MSVAESGQATTTGDQGNFVLGQVAPGKYTLVFTKDGYVRQVKADVLVNAGQLADVQVALTGEFTDMDEFVVQDILPVGAGSEASLLKLRFESPQLMDSISAELMTRAGASDAAQALHLVAGTSVQNEKSAVIRGLPDRYVSSQLNGVRLPTADEDKRAVELDQFPAAVIESIQVSKTFTPDQQGDASGGAVNVRLKGIPDKTLIQGKSQISSNSQVTGRRDFLTYKGGGLDFWGRDDGDRDIQWGNLGSNWDGAVGTTRGSAPTDYKWSGAAGGNYEFENGLKIGGLASVFYERDSSFFDNGIDDSYWVQSPGAKMTPQTFQGTVGDGDFKTGLFDITQGKQSVRWGGLGTFGVETEENALNVSYLYTHVAEDAATLATDTRGKAYFFPNYDPNDPIGKGNTASDLSAAPYLRLETLEYTERTTGTLQFNGRHKLPIDGFDIEGLFNFRAPELDWTLAKSSADLDQPDKRQFGALWLPPSYSRGAPPFEPPSTSPPSWFPYKPAANFTLGNLQRIWKQIEEDSNQHFVNLKFPFEQWTKNMGYVKTGLFFDHVKRTFNQDTFSNFADNSSFHGDWNQPWSDTFPFEDHPISESLFDVDYKGDTKTSAWYSMIDLPFDSWVNLIGGWRVEHTETSIINDPEQNALWFPAGSTAPQKLNPGEADVSFAQHDVLPVAELIVKPWQEITLRGAYTQTVAHQTFKELTPILQQEYVGGPIFIGNPDLQMSGLHNYDVRADFTPYEQSLLSASWFHKKIEDPIEYVQRFVGFDYTTAVNYPKGELTGYELEARQGLGRFWDPLTGIAVGANATFIHSVVTLPEDEAAGFDDANIRTPMTKRDMTNAPDHLYNVYFTYDIEPTGTELAVFYTIQGDTLIAGATQSAGNFVPSVYAKEYDTLNLSVTQRLGKYFKLQFQAKNLTNPEIDTVYRSKFIGDDVTKTSYTKGIELALSLSAEFAF